MHTNKVSLAVLVDGKPLYEKKGNVFLPYGSTYEILIKNNNNFDIIADVSLDLNFSNDTFLVKAKSKRVVKGFSYDDSFYKFRFVEKIKEMNLDSQTKMLNGTISISLFKNEKKDPFSPFLKTNRPFEPTKINPLQPILPECPDVEPFVSPAPEFDKSKIRYDNTNGVDRVKFISNYSNMEEDAFINSSLNSDSTSLKSKGANVFGEPVVEKAYNKNYSLTGILGSVLYTLHGENEDCIKINKPIFAKDNIECKICGNKSKLGDKYCSKCGSFIVVTDSVLEKEPIEKKCCGKTLSKDYLYCPYCSEKV